MKIVITSHALERAEERGTNKGEIEDVVNNGFPAFASGNRLGRAKVYYFHGKRNNKYYDQKKVEVIYYVKENEIIVVTVYVFYGKWEE
jgi:hypothetical protein